MNAFTNRRGSGRRGFTLVELMVVIGIIGLLLTILYASFQGAREESRNTAVRTALKEAQLALETYEAQNDHYPPIPTGFCTSSGGGERTRTSQACGELMIEDLAPDFISEVPTEDLSGNPNCNFIYVTEDSDEPNTYKLTASECVEGVESQAEGIGQDQELARCPSSCPTTGNCDPSDVAFYTSYAVYGNGGECY